MILFLFFLSFDNFFFDHEDFFFLFHCVLMALGLTICFDLISTKLSRCIKKSQDFGLVFDFAWKKTNSITYKIKIWDQNWHRGKITKAFPFFFIIHPSRFKRNLEVGYFFISFLVPLVWKLYMLVQNFILSTFQSPSLKEKRERESLIKGKWERKRLVIRISWVKKS